MWRPLYKPQARSARIPDPTNHRIFNEFLGQNVAIKKMSYSGRVNEKFGEIMKEVKLLQRIRNDYVVELIGTFLKEKEYSAWIIMEYCLGSVSDCVEVRVFEQFYFDFLIYRAARYMGPHIRLKFMLRAELH